MCSLSQHFHCCDKHCDKSTLGWKGFICLVYHNPLWEAKAGALIKTGTWSPELMQRPWTGTAHWLAPCGLFSLLIENQNLHHWDVTTHSGLDPPTLITN